MWVINDKHGVQLEIGSYVYHSAFGVCKVKKLTSRLYGRSSVGLDIIINGSYITEYAYWVERISDEEAILRMLGGK